MWDKNWLQLVNLTRFGCTTFPAKISNFCNSNKCFLVRFSLILKNVFQIFENGENFKILCVVNIYPSHVLIPVVYGSLWLHFLRMRSAHFACYMFRILFLE